MAFLGSSTLAEQAKQKGDFERWQTERWYGTRYAELPLNVSALATPSADVVALERTLRPAPKNPYLPTNFELVKTLNASSPATPRILSRTSTERLWHVTDTSYKVPMGLVGLKYSVHAPDSLCISTCISQVPMGLVGLKYYMPSLTSNVVAQLDASLLLHMLVSQIRATLYELGEADDLLSACI